MAQTLLGALFQNESGGRNIPNVHEGTSSGQAQGYFQITTGTWNEFGGQQYAPTPLQATYAQQAAIAAKIPLKRWDEPTVALMRKTGRPIDPNRTLGENLAMNGEGFGTDPQAQQRDPNQPLSTPATAANDPRIATDKPGVLSQEAQIGQNTAIPQKPQQGPYPTPDPALSYFPPAPDAKKSLRDKLAEAAGNWKVPAPGVALNDTTLAGQAIPKAARVDVPEANMFDPNAMAQQRNDLAMAMQRLNTGKLWL
jgi:hypothetical protein